MRFTDVRWLFVFAHIILNSCCVGDEIKRHSSPNIQWETKLVNHLVGHRHYSKQVFPQNGRGPVRIKIRLALTQLLEMNLKNSYIKFQSWLRFWWDDVSLTWDPAEFGNITKIMIDSELVWTPDITIYETISENHNPMKILSTSLVGITHQGRMDVSVPHIMTASTEFDISRFPYDTQNCIITFGSWSFTGEKIGVYPESNSADLSYFVPHNELDLLDVAAERHVKYYPCCSEPYISVVYTLRFKRRPLHYVLSFMLPCALLSTLSTMVFLIPTPSGEKLTFSLTLILGMTVFELLFVENMPPASKTVPLLSIYFVTEMVIMGISTMCTGLVLHIHHSNDRANHHVPDVLRRVMFIQAARWLGMRGHVHKLNEKQFNLLGADYFKQNKLNRCKVEDAESATAKKKKNTHSWWQLNCACNFLSSKTQVENMNFIAKTNDDVADAYLLQQRETRASSEARGKPVTPRRVGAAATLGGSLHELNNGDVRNGSYPQVGVPMRPSRCITPRKPPIAGAYDPNVSDIPAMDTSYISDTSFQVRTDHIGFHWAGAGPQQRTLIECYPELQLNSNPVRSYCQAMPGYRSLTRSRSNLSLTQPSTTSGGGGKGTFTPKSTKRSPSLSFMTSQQRYEGLVGELITIRDKLVGRVDKVHDHLAAKLRKKRLNDFRKAEWFVLAVIFDRIFFAIFMLVNLLMAAFIFSPALV